MIPFLIAKFNISCSFDPNPITAAFVVSCVAQFVISIKITSIYSKRASKKPFTCYSNFFLKALCFNSKKLHPSKITHAAFRSSQTFEISYLFLVMCLDFLVQVFVNFPQNRLCILRTINIEVIYISVST